MDGSIRSSQRELLIVINEGDSGWEKAGGKGGSQWVKPRVGEKKIYLQGKKRKHKICQHDNARNLIFSLFDYRKDLNFVKHVGQDTYFEANFHSVFNTFL